MQSKEDRLLRGRVWARRLDLEDCLSLYPRQVSGGQRQRVVLARTFALNPPVCCFDEPFSALDAQTRNDVQEDLERVRDPSQTMLFVTHSIDEAVFVADVVHLMRPIPSRIVRSYDIRPLSRPRNRIAEDFVRMRSEILADLQDMKKSPPQ
jgi:NitT/TauT family transport system ATP-binding protein